MRRWIYGLVVRLMHVYRREGSMVQARWMTGNGVLYCEISVSAGLVSVNQRA